MLRGSISMRQTHPQETFLVCGCKVRGFALIVQYLKIVVLFIWLNESVRFLLSIIIIHATTNLYNRQYHFISWMSKKLLFFVLQLLLIVPYLFSFPLNFIQHIRMRAVCFRGCASRAPLSQKSQETPSSRKISRCRASL